MNRFGGLAGRLRRRLGSDGAGAAFYLAGLTNVTVLFSIAISQTLLGLSVAALLWTRRRLEVPSIIVPLGCYAAWTLASLATAPDPLLGLAQIKKFYIFLIVPAAYTAFRDLAQLRRVWSALFAAASLAALLAVLEFGLYYQGLHSQSDFYRLYTLGSRITGFMGHWQTFSGEQMLVLAALLSFLLFAQRRPRWIWAAAAVIALSLLLSFTRGVWLGCLAAAAYLLWQFKRPLVLAIPTLLVVLYLVAPGMVRERVRSLVDTRSDSSNQARLLMMKTGWNIIRQHPLFGVGPNGVRRYFDEYRPNREQPKPIAYYGHLHNTYLHIAAERGLPCLAFFAWLLFSVVRDQRRLAARLDAGDRHFAHGVVAACIAFAVAGAFENNFGDSEVAMLFLFYVTHGYVAERAVARVSAGGSRLSAVGSGQ